MATITNYPLDLTGSNIDNLVTGEKQLLLSRGNTPFRVVSFKAGGFYANTVEIYSSAFKKLKPHQDFICTYKFVDGSDYTGMLICGAVVIINNSLSGEVYLNGQVVGSDYAYSLTAEEDTIEYLETLGSAIPSWGGFIGVYPQWQGGELKKERWKKTDYGDLNYSLEKIVMALMGEAGGQESESKDEIKQIYQNYLDNFGTDVPDHIADKNNPHKTNKDSIGLSFIHNWPQAPNTLTWAQATTTNQVYATAKNLDDLVEAAKYELTVHIQTKHTAHNPTAAGIGVYTKPQLDALVVPLLLKNGTAANTAQLARTVSGGQINYSKNEVKNLFRENLDASHFTGRIHVNRLAALGTVNDDCLVGALGNWVNVKDEYLAVKFTTDFKIFFIGHFEVVEGVIPHLEANYPSESNGTIAIYTKPTQFGELLHGHNGKVYYYTIAMRMTAVKGPSGWALL